MYGSKRWRELRSAHLMLEPVCAVCGGPAEVVHHIQEHGGDPALFFLPSNLQTVCAVCHNRLHLRGSAAQRTSTGGGAPKSSKESVSDIGTLAVSQYARMEKVNHDE